MKNNLHANSSNPLYDWMTAFPLPMDQRPSWDEYFLLIACIVSKRSSCLRRKVGAVIVKDKDVISTGYNGAPQHQPNCIDIGNCYRNLHKIQSGTQLERCRASGSHGESNAIVLAAKNGHSTENSTLYIYGHEFICNMCKGMIANAGIDRVIHLRDSGVTREYDVARDWVKSVLDQEKIQ